MLVCSNFEDTIWNRHILEYNVEEWERVVQPQALLHGHEYTYTDTGMIQHDTPMQQIIENTSKIEVLCLIRVWDMCPIRFWHNIWSFVLPRPQVLDIQLSIIFLGYGIGNLGSSNELKSN